MPLRNKSVLEKMAENHDFLAVVRFLFENRGFASFIPYNRDLTQRRGGLSTWSLIQPPRRIFVFLTQKKTMWDKRLIY